MEAQTLRIQNETAPADFHSWISGRATARLPAEPIHRPRRHLPLHLHRRGKERSNGHHPK